MWLHIGVFCIEKLAYAFDSQVLYLVDNLTATIIALARITLGIFVGKNTAHGLHNLVRNEILACDEFYATHLAGTLFAD